MIQISDATKLLSLIQEIEILNFLQKNQLPIPVSLLKVEWKRGLIIFTHQRGNQGITVERRCLKILIMSSITNLILTSCLIVRVMMNVILTICQGIVIIELDSFSIVRVTMSQTTIN